MTIQVKAIEQYFPVVHFVMLYKVVVSSESVGEIQSVTIQMKAIEQYFPAVLFVMLDKVVLTFSFGTGCFSVFRETKFDELFGETELSITVSSSFQIHSKKTKKAPSDVKLTTDS